MEKQNLPKIIFFYILFYAALTGFFAAMLAVFYQTLETDKPKWQLDNGLIGSNPGLGFRPMPPEANIESTLIWYETKKVDPHWLDSLQEFVDSLEDLPRQNRVNCSFDNPAPEGKVCSLDLSEFGECIKEKKFGYEKGKPCIFLKLNKIYNWIPDTYRTTTDLPPEMPKDLSKHIGEQVDMNKPTNVIWVSCEGENPADQESLKAIMYHPRRGFPGYYFPFKNIDGYMPPVVAVEFEVQTGVLINIECKAWARNIHHDRSERKGSVHFELMVD